MDSKLHILFLCGWYPSRVLPNNGDFIQRHAEAVSTLHQVSVIHIISDDNCTDPIEISIKKINGIITYIAYIKPSKNYITKSFRFIKAFSKLLKQIPFFDAVHLNKLFPFGIFAVYLNKIKKKDFIITEHWTNYHMPQAKNISKLEIFLSKIIAKKAKHISPVSNDLKLSMQKLGIQGNYNIVPNVVDTQLFIPNKKINKKFSILHVSNMLDTHKNVSGIIRSIKEFSNFTTNFEVNLIGGNSHQYQSIANNLNISNYINFIDQVPHQQIINFMQNADVFVLFSNYENLPCVILESFSCGTPVISTNVGGISEFFPEHFGFLIEPNNEKQLVEKLINMYQNPINKQDELNNYAQKHFSKETIAKGFTKLYTS